MRILKSNWKTLLPLSLSYLLLTFFAVFFVQQNTIQIDSTRLLAEAPSTGTLLPKDTTDPGVTAIKNGAAYSRQLTASQISIIVPVYKNGQIESYSLLTDQRSPIGETVGLIIFLTSSFYLLSLYIMVRRAFRARTYVGNTVAKIKAIERSPLTQNYLIAKDDDEVSTALNQLGETIQSRIQSNREKKKNIYEFIEFFQFPIFIYDNKGRIHHSNAAFKNEFSTSDSLDQFSPYTEFLNFLVDKMLTPTLQDKTIYFEAIQAYYEVEFLPLTLADIERRYMVTLNDVTAYQQALQAQKDLIANVSHELKTPLTSIRGFADILASGQEQQKFASLISKESNRLLALVADTLLLTHTNAQIRKDPLDLRALIQQILENFQPQILEKNLKISVKLEAITRNSNEKMAYAIFKNLIENAILYTPVAGEVVISLTSRQFTVRDTGPGLTELERLRIFERFYRTEAASQSNQQGTGLGLAIVAKNVLELGWQINVESQLGEGTRFTVTF